MCQYELKNLILLPTKELEKICLKIEKLIEIFFNFPVRTFHVLERIIKISVIFLSD
jgi:hypothetical protein